MVSLLPSIDGRLFRIKGGNRLLPERLIKAASAQLINNSQVTQIVRAPEGSFSLQVQHLGGAEEVRPMRHAA